MQPLVRTLSMILATALLTACGADLAATSAPKSSTKTIISMPNLPQLGDLARNHLGGSVLDDGRGGDLLLSVRKGLLSAEGFESEVISRTFGPYRNGEEQDVSAEARVAYQIAWARPNRFYAQVLASSFGEFEKVQLMTEDGAKFAVRAPGLFGKLVRSVSAGDNRLKNARGHAMATLYPDAQFNRLVAPQAVWTVIGEGVTPAGEKTWRIAVANVPRLDKEIDREEVELTQGDYKLFQLVSYVGMRRVVSYEFKDFRWGVPPAEAFAFK